MVRSRTKGRHVVVVGDVNTAHSEIDVYNDKEKLPVTCSGFLPRERKWMDDFVASGFVDGACSCPFVDVFRHFHPGETGHYTWWSMKRRAREVNQGWRIDYTLVDRGMFQFRQDGADNDVESELHDESAVQGVVAGAGILKEQRGSDHCPIYIDFKSIQFPPPPIKPPALSSLHALRKKEAQKNRMMSFFTRRPPVPKVTSDGNDHRDKRVKKCPALSPLLSEDDVQ
eukprot:TRINITY_DN1095_c0_g1_i4.p1 TRINITY_DN1095_c0_g1~~TRINITY_DN1095_c0_g1_i4.p1  ORF type:complete len:227 (-),score=32.20 TRINITY_DN1095_c0_g1_i4:42-722(-)